MPTTVAIDGRGAKSTAYAPPTPYAAKASQLFSETLKKAGWKCAFNWPYVSSQQIKKNSLGGQSIFNNVNLGLLMTHGSYATTVEDDNVKYTYVDLKNTSGSLDYVRLTDMDFGSAGPLGGLRWMALDCCNLLRADNIASMTSGRLPINSNLHLLCGGSSTLYGNEIIEQLFAQYLVANQTIPNAWINAFAKAYTHPSYEPITEPVSVRIEGWHDCFGDTLSSYYLPDPDHGLYYKDVNVYTPQ